LIALTLTFEFSNGWHDAATPLPPSFHARAHAIPAVAWAAFWNFIAAFVFGTAVAKTIGKGMVHIEMVSQQVLLAGLLGAIFWNLITLILGCLPFIARPDGRLRRRRSSERRFFRHHRQRLDEASPVHFSLSHHRHDRRHDRHHRHQLDRFGSSAR